MGKKATINWIHTSTYMIELFNRIPLSCGDSGFFFFFLIQGLILAWQSVVKAFTAFRALLQANYSAEQSVWQPATDNRISFIYPPTFTFTNGRLVHFLKIWSVPNSPYCQHRAATLDPASSIKKSSPNCHYYLQGAVTPDWMGSFVFWEHITAFFQGRRNPLRM